MRKCIRCNTQMINSKENKVGEKVKLKVYNYGGNGSNSELVIGTDDGFFKPTFSENIKVAICPNCGEVSFYIEN